MMDRVPMLAIICVVLLVTLSGAAQDAPPVNDRANPYALVRNWPQLTEGRTLGGVSGVDIDRDVDMVETSVRVRILGRIADRHDDKTLHDASCELAFRTDAVSA
jgi:hypothetical protein